MKIVLQLSLWLPTKLSCCFGEVDGRVLSVALASWKHIKIFGFRLAEHGGNLIESICFLCSKWIPITFPSLACQYDALDDVSYIGEVSKLSSRSDDCEFLVFLNAIFPDIDKRKILLSKHFTIAIDVVKVDNNEIKTKPVSVAVY